MTLADITVTRYVRVAPTTLRDPVLTAHGGRLRAEVFSADNSVYARLDLAGDALDGGDIAHGTTNVDIGDEMRRTLALVTNDELLHLDVGSAGLAAATPRSHAQERPVQMPDRWVRALGNVAELHRGLEHRFDVSATHARAFLASLPPATATDRHGWLSALRRLLTLVTGLTVYGSAGGSAVRCSCPAPAYSSPARRRQRAGTPARARTSTASCRTTRIASSATTRASPAPAASRRARVRSAATARPSSSTTATGSIG